MVKKHLKRIAANKTWPISVKADKFITRPKPGAHAREFGLPLVVAIRDILEIARTRKEVRDILLHEEVLVDGIKRKSHKMIVGFMDVITFPKLKESYRITLNKKGKLDLIKIDNNEAKLKLVRLNGKTAIGKKFQLNFSDGNNLLIDDGKDYKVKDSLLIEVPEKKIKEHFKFEKKATILLTGGRHIGTVGVVESVEDNKLVFKTKDNEIFETSKKHAFVIGKTKPSIKIE